MEGCGTGHGEPNCGCSDLKKAGNRLGWTGLTMTGIGIVTGVVAYVAGGPIIWGIGLLSGIIGGITGVASLGASSAAGWLCKHALICFSDRRYLRLGISDAL
jgi:hypothetical protein